MRVLQGREQSQNRALLESAKAGCGDTHVRQNKSVFFSAGLKTISLKKSKAFKIVVLPEALAPKIKANFNSLNPPLASII
jgi:hypothetical protein